MSMRAYVHEWFIYLLAYLHTHTHTHTHTHGLFLIVVVTCKDKISTATPNITKPAFPQMRFELDNAAAAAAAAER